LRNKWLIVGIVTSSKSLKTFTQTSYFVH